jgi:hypothetical protein
MKILALTLLLSLAGCAQRWVHESGTIPASFHEDNYMCHVSAWNEPLYKTCMATKGYSLVSR